ncbi:MAG: hypothetical protein HXY49_12210 [Ignavibacteriaceae bacterium]|nr:hypothetical protein [Ignavibacteriaceae bacterium]
MRTFTYSFFSRLILKFGNIPVTILLSLYLGYFVVKLDKNLLFLLPIVITLLLIYFLNKHYLILFQNLPYRIQADDDKMICDKFMFSKKVHTVFFNDIESLTGGIFSGRTYGLMKVFDKRNNITIAFYHRISNAKLLETLILSRISKELYDSVLKQMQANK